MRKSYKDKFAEGVKEMFGVKGEVEKFGASEIDDLERQEKQEDERGGAPSQPPEQPQRKRPDSREWRRDIENGPEENPPENFPSRRPERDSAARDRWREKWMEDFMADLEQAGQEEDEPEPAEPAEDGTGTRGYQPRRRLQEPVETGQKKDARKKVYLDFVIDTTLSFSKVFLPVYYALDYFLKYTEDRKKEFKGVLIQYGLTVFRTDADAVQFSGNRYFTESETELLEELQKITFSGGSPSGRENLAGAVDQALRVLNNQSDEEADRGLLLFTDSLPEEGKMRPDFTSPDQKGYFNRGVRFAQIYSYDGSFHPMLTAVNADAEPVENGKNTITYNSLDQLIDLDEDAVKEQIRSIVDDILRKSSVV